MRELDGQRRWNKYPKKHAGKKAEVVWACIEKRRKTRGQENDGDGGAGGKKERKTKEEVVG